MERTDKDQRVRVLVDCDYNCGAYYYPDPDSLQELRAALEHWQSHEYLAGCSHAR